MVVCGIDPGISPGVVVIRGASVLCSARLPSVLDSPDGAMELRDILERHSVSRVVIEKVGLVRGQDLAAGARFMTSVGVILGVSTVSGAVVTQVAPHVWKPAVFTPEELGRGLPQEKVKKHQKASAVALVTRLYPKVAMIAPRCRTPDHNIADACCLAHWWQQTCTRE